MQHRLTFFNGSLVDWSLIRRGEVFEVAREKIHKAFLKRTRTKSAITRKLKYNQANNF